MIKIDESIAQLVSEIVKNQTKFYELTEQLEAKLGFEFGDAHLQNLIDEVYHNRPEGVTYLEAEAIASELKVVSDVHRK